ncbi:MAG TPA: hypothetical protein VG963_13325 [Polyangiaceae bacterium]|nr:hypothetical protein [Polyangiaceae bacterium]
MSPSPPPPALASAGEAALAQLDRELDYYADQTRHERMTRGIVGGTLGALMLPSGIVLQQRHDALLRLTGIGLIAGGAAQLLTVPGLFIPSGMERMQRRFQVRKASGLAPDVIVRETESEWQRGAEGEHRGRAFVGFIYLGTSAGLLSTGLAFLFKDSIGGLSHNRRINIGSTFLGMGIPFLAIGAELVWIPGAKQRAWEAHLRTRDLAGPVARVRLGLVPAARGGLLSARLEL